MASGVTRVWDGTEFIEIAGTPGPAGPQGPQGTPGSGGTTFHDSLTDVSADQHHARYQDAEAVAAVDGLYLPLTGGTMVGALITFGGTSAAPGLGIGGAGQGFSGGASAINVHFDGDKALGIQPNLVSLYSNGLIALQVSDSALTSSRPLVINGVEFSNSLDGLLAFHPGGWATTPETPLYTDVGPYIYHQILDNLELRCAEVAMGAVVTSSAANVTTKASGSWPEGTNFMRPAQVSAVQSAKVAGVAGVRVAFDPSPLLGLSVSAATIPGLDVSDQRSGVAFPMIVADDLEAIFPAAIDLGIGVNPDGTNGGPNGDKWVNTNIVQALLLALVQDIEARVTTLEP